MVSQDDFSLKARFLKTQAGNPFFVLVFRAGRIRGRDWVKELSLILSQKNSLIFGYN
jgi:hypothetical protein